MLRFGQNCLRVNQMKIPKGFVTRECGCVWFHLQNNVGWLIKDCDEKDVGIGLTVELPNNQKFQSTKLVEIERIFEELGKMSRLANVGLRFKSLLKFAEGN